MVDALKDFVPKGSGLFLKPTASEPVTIRVLTLDPLVSIDKFGNTRYSFIVYNWTEGKAQILSKGAGILNQLSAIHRDEDYDALNKIDVKITTTGEGLETRYTIMPLPKAKTLETDMIHQAEAIDLEKAIPENKGRLSQVDREENMKETVTDEEMDAEIDLNAVNPDDFDPNSIPF